jgi:hypothetical protein
MDILEIMKNVSELQLKALAKNDSGWQLMSESKSYKSYLRILHLDHEPSDTYIDVCYRSAPAHSSRHHTIFRSPEVDLYTVSLYAEVDSGD